MKKIFGTLILLAGLHLSSFAQEAANRPMMHQRTPEERATRQTEMLNRSVTLTADQRTQIYDVNLKTAKQAEKFKEDKDPANFRAIQDARENAYKKILTEEQFKKYEEVKAARRAHRGHEGEAPETDNIK